MSCPRKQQLRSPLRRSQFTMVPPKDLRLMDGTVAWCISFWMRPGSCACKLSVTHLSDVSLMSETADVTNIQSQCCGKKIKHTVKRIDILTKRITRHEPSNSHYKKHKALPISPLLRNVARYNKNGLNIVTIGQFAQKLQSSARNAIVELFSPIIFVYLQNCNSL
jgi:hypothetical protein